MRVIQIKGTDYKRKNKRGKLVATMLHKADIGLSLKSFDAISTELCINEQQLAELLVYGRSERVLVGGDYVVRHVYTSK